MEQLAFRPLQWAFDRDAERRAASTARGRRYRRQGSLSLLLRGARNDERRLRCEGRKRHAGSCSRAQTSRTAQGRPSVPKRAALGIVQEGVRFARRRESRPYQGELQGWRSRVDDREAARVQAGQDPDQLRSKCGAPRQSQRRAVTVRVSPAFISNDRLFESIHHIIPNSGGLNGNTSLALSPP